MSKVNSRSAGAPSCSGRMPCIQGYTNMVSFPRMLYSTPAWIKLGRRASFQLVPKSLGPDQYRSAPPLADEPLKESTAAEPEAVQPRINTSNFNAMAALASVGMVETTYLSYVKLFNGSLLCPTDGCESVLNSPYAQLFGLPLSLFGLLAYSTVGALAVSYVRQPQDAASSSAREITLLALTAGVAALATTSTVLISILQTRLGSTPCAWCYLSAGISMTLAVTLGTTLTGRQLKDNALVGVGAALATAAILYAGLLKGSASAGKVYDENFSLPYQTPLVSTTSTDRTLDLARRLSSVGARMYGAFWCSHCLEQKEEFGSGAMAEFPYVECFPNGWKRDEMVAPACKAANVRAFPTWVIGDKSVEGMLQLDEIEREVARAEAAAATVGRVDGSA